MMSSTSPERAACWLFLSALGVLSTGFVVFLSTPEWRTSIGLFTAQDLDLVLQHRLREFREVELPKILDQYDQTEAHRPGLALAAVEGRDEDLDTVAARGLLRSSSDEERRTATATGTDPAAAEHQQQQQPRRTAKKVEGIVLVPSGNTGSGGGGAGGNNKNAKAKQLRADLQGLQQEISVLRKSLAAAEDRNKKQQVILKKQLEQQLDSEFARRAKKKNAGANNRVAKGALAKDVTALKAQVSKLQRNLKNTNKLVGKVNGRATNLSKRLNAHVADTAVSVTPDDGSSNTGGTEDGGSTDDVSTELLEPIERCLASIAHRIPSDEVLPSDTELVLPRQQAGSDLPLIAPITAYNWRGKELFPADKFERPIYNNLKRDTMDFWNYLVDELLLSRVPIVMLHGRGCTSLEDGDEGPGNLCPRLLRHFVKAVELAGAQDVIKVGMFDATDGSKPEMAGVDKLDLSDPDNWKYFWDHNIKIWFDILPKSWWYLVDGKPVIASWSLRDKSFENQEGSASRMIDWIKQQFKQRYGMEPAFILQNNWFHEDSTLTEEHALGQHCWFTPKSDEIDSVNSLCTFNEKVWGVTTPSFRDAKTVEGCGDECREVTRRNGTTLTNALQQAVDADAAFVLLEGWTDMAESAGFYRSEHWQYPAQYINIVRQYSDPEPETLRFQAEGADSFSDTTDKNLGKDYSDRALDVDALPDGSGWYVGFTEASEWLEYQNVQLGCGRYRFTAKVATRGSGKKLRLDVGGVSLPTVEAPATGGIESYGLVHLGQIKLLGGSYNLRLVFETGGGLNVDWFFVKRSSDCYCELDEPAVI